VQFLLKIRRDYYAGALMMLIGLIVVNEGRTYQLGTLQRMGPGYFPVVLGALLVLLGILIAGTASTGGAEDRMTSLVRHVLGETEAVWKEVLPAQKGVRYVDAKLVLYDGSTDSGCGGAQAAMGPFYCPVDKTVYLDMSFFRDMQTKYGGGGDFAYAYVISHEIGHHVQDLLGILGKVEDAKQGVSRTQANALSVRIELMADCFAGVFANHANKDWKLTEDDLQKALATARAIGDDRLQTAARGYSVPDSFTHGSSAMRQQWLTTGLKSGQVDSCNTFAR